MDEKNEQIVDESKEVTDEDLAKVKAEAQAQEEVETSTEADESSEVQVEEEAEEESEAQAETPTFTKKFPNIKGDTPEEYAANLEAAYENSFAELHRLRGGKSENEGQPAVAETDTKTDNPALVYAETMWQNETNKAFNELKEKYPQVMDVENFNKFQASVSSVSSALTSVKGIAPTISEAYLETAKMLGWEPVDSKEKLGGAVKNAVASTKTSSSAPKPVPKSPVTSKEIKLARQMNPGLADKSDAEIRAELEQYA